MAQKTRKLGGEQANQKTENWYAIYVKTRKLENSCRIYVGSPPHHTTTNTRHTPHQQTPQPQPTTITATHHCHHHPSPPTTPHHPSPPSKPTKPTKSPKPQPQPRAPVHLSRPRAWVRFLWGDIGQHHQPTRQHGQPASHGRPASQPATGNRQQAAGNR